MDETRLEYDPGRPPRAAHRAIARDVRVDIVCVRTPRARAHDVGDFLHLHVRQGVRQGTRARARRGREWDGRDRRARSRPTGAIAGAATRDALQGTTTAWIGRARVCAADGRGRGRGGDARDAWGVDNARDRDSVRTSTDGARAGRWTTT